MQTWFKIFGKMARRLTSYPLDHTGDYNSSNGNTSNNAHINDHTSIPMLDEPTLKQDLSNAIAIETVATPLSATTATPNEPYDRLPLQREPVSVAAVKVVVETLHKRLMRSMSNHRSEANRAEKQSACRGAFSYPRICDVLRDSLRRR